MKNNSHNLIHQLARHLDFTWERHNFYKKDAEEVNCERCKKLWEDIYSDHLKHVEMLKKELENHLKEGTLV